MDEFEHDLSRMLQDRVVRDTGDVRRAARAARPGATAPDGQIVGPRRDRRARDHGCHGRGRADRGPAGFGPARHEPDGAADQHGRADHNVSVGGVDAAGAGRACPRSRARSSPRSIGRRSRPRRPRRGSRRPATRPCSRGSKSFAGTSDPRYVVLGPSGWRCQMQVATDGDNAVVVFPPPEASAEPAPDLSTAPIAIENDYLWHGISGTTRACTVTTAPAVGAEAKQISAPCAVPAGRALTPVDAHVTMFVDANGNRGASWLAAAVVARRRRRPDQHSHVRSEGGPHCRRMRHDHRRLVVASLSVPFSATPTTSTPPGRAVAARASTAG